PQGAYYGGLTAAPLTASMLQQALAGRRSVIDRTVVAEQTRRRDDATEGRRDATPEEEEDGSATSVRLPLGDERVRPGGQISVPDVVGQPVRGAVYAVHRRGLRARIEGSGTVVVRSVPVAGDSLGAGRTVVLVTGAEKSP
ncbi:MAG TPA: PASTA domain-containing protein, partial [Gemmatimonadales bacterium]